MERPTKAVVDCVTGEQSIVPLTDEEIEQLKKIAEESEQRRITQEAEAQAKAEAKASAESKLAALGLTAEEIAALSK